MTEIQSGTDLNEAGTSLRLGPDDRGCRWCDAMPHEYCEEDCGGPAPVLHPDCDVEAYL